MKIISTISKIFIYGLSGVLTSVTLVLIVQSLFSKFREDRVWHIMLLVSTSTFVISAIVGAIIDRSHTTQYKKYIKNGVKIGISVSIISFLVFAIPYSIFETDSKPRK